jgi:hypothetical protein
MGRATIQLGRGVCRLVALAVTLAPLSASAAGLSPRSIQVGSSGQGVTTSYSPSFTTATTSNIGSIKFEFCTNPTGACTTPGGVTTTSAAVTAQSGAIGFTIVNTTNGAPYLTRTAANVNTGTPLGYTLTPITNPAATNTSYFVRITTYSGTDGATGPVDTGTVAMSTAQPVQLTGSNAGNSGVLRRDVDWQ